jgi:N-acyl-D-amino-acid deacylase
MFLLAGAPENILLVGFRNERLKPLAGKTLAEVAAMRGSSAIDTIMDLVIEDDSRVQTIYFMIDEHNLQTALQLPWVSFGSDAASLAPEGVFLQSSTHPRAYGCFARVLGRYVRELGLISLQEAVRKLSALPAANLKLRGRGRLEPGYFADVVVFDPGSIVDHATYAEPQRYATGVEHVFVNGVQVLRRGEHTGATPGRAVFGPGLRAN